MANRFPLVLDTTDNNKIKEIQTGDNLYLADNSITGVQNITALGTIDAADIKVNGNRLVAQAFNDLTDTPSTFVGSPNYFVKVKSDGTGLEYRPLADLGNIEIDTITVDTSIVPTTDNVGNVGTEAKKFNEIVGTSIKGNLVSYAEEIVFDATTGKVSYAALQGAPTFLSEFTDDVGYLQTSDLNTTLAGLFDDGVPFVTDIVGSVFGDDSTLLVDGVNGKIIGDVLNTEVATTDLITTNATITTTTATTINGPSTGNLAIDAGTSGIINIGAGASTTAVNIKNAVLDSFNIDSGIGPARITSSTDLIITASNKIRIEGGVSFRFSSTDSTNQLAIAAEEGDVIYNTTTSRLQMYQGNAWKDVNGNVEATAGTSNFNDVVIAGNFTVTGTTTTVNTEEINLADNIINLNSNLDAAVAPTQDSGISINRGSATAKTFKWNETTDKWTIGDETFVAATFEGGFTGVVGGATPAAVTGTTITANTAFVGNLTGNAAGAHTGTFDGDMTGTMSGDDSTILVDGVNNKIVGAVETFSLRTTNATIALGYLAGQTDQENSSIAIGNQAGNNAQTGGAVGIGYKAGNNTQGLGAVALGYQAGQNTQGGNAIAIGELAGQTNQSGHGIALGYATGQTAQGESAIAIGKLAGYANQAANSIVLNATGLELNNTQASSTVIQPVRNVTSANIAMYNPTSGELTHTATPGTLAANIDQATLAIGAATATTIGIGNAGSTTTINGILSSPALVSGNITADDSMQITTAVGTNNGITLNPQGTGTSVNITSDAIRTFGSPFTDAITAQAGVVGDLKGSVVADDSTVMIDGVGGKVVGNIETASLRTSETTIALGGNAGATNQGNLAVAIGNGAGQISQGAASVAIGDQAGLDTQGTSAIAIGNAGSSNQGAQAIAIGDSAGYTGQGAQAIAIGGYAGNISQAANSIVLNATSSAVQNTTANSLVIKPIRSAVGTTMLMYDATSGEVTHSSTIVGTFDGDVTGSVFSDDSSPMVDAVNRTMFSDIMTLSPLVASPITPTSGMIVVADGSTWDPASKSGAVSYPVFYDGVSWNALY